MAWDCPSCLTKQVTGRICPVCGTPQPTETPRTADQPTGAPRPSWSLWRILTGVLSVIGFIALLPITRGGKFAYRRSALSDVPDEGSVGMALYAVVGGVVTIIGILVLGYIGSAYVAERSRPTPTPFTVESGKAKLATIRPALESQIPAWQQVTDRQIHTVDPASIGLDRNSSITEIDYGYCPSGKFYVYALQGKGPSIIDNILSSESFAYGDASENCAPSENWRIVKRAMLDGNWSYVTALILTTPLPTATAQF